MAFIVTVTSLHFSQYDKADPEVLFESAKELTLKYLDFVESGELDKLTTPTLNVEMVQTKKGTSLKLSVRENFVEGNTDKDTT